MLNKKILSVVLAAIMSTSVMPATAEEANVREEVAVSDAETEENKEAEGVSEEEQNGPTEESEAVTAQEAEDILIPEQGNDSDGITKKEENGEGTAADDSISGETEAEATVSDGSDQETAISEETEEIVVMDDDSVVAETTPATDADDDAATEAATAETAEDTTSSHPQTEDEVPLTPEQLRAFNEKTAVWKSAGRIVVVYETVDDIDLECTVYPADSDQAVRSSKLEWNSEEEFYIAELDVNELAHSAARIVLDDGTHKYEVTVSTGGSDAVELKTENEDGRITLIWNESDIAEGYHIYVEKEDSTFEVYKTDSSLFSLDTEADSISEIAVVAFNYNEGVKQFGEAVFCQPQNSDESTASVGAGGVVPTETADETEPKDGAVADSVETEETTVAEPPQETAKADEIPKEGTCGENLTWKIDSDGVLTISGTGEMKFTSGTSYFAPWEESGYSITKIVVEEGVTSIANNAFKSCFAATEVSLPDSLTDIGVNAFEYMSAVETLEIPDSVTRIGDGAFFSMTHLQQIMIPDSVTSLGSGTFKYCFALQSVSLGSGVKTINSSLFEGDRSLKKVNIAGPVIWLGIKAFYNCTALESFVIPDSVSIIYDSAFKGCSALKAITIPGNVKTFGREVFSECSSLTQATVSEGIREIPESTFKGCTALTKVSLPESLKVIGNRAFYECTSLKEILLPAGLEYLGDEAFLGCTSLSKVTMPEEAPEAGQNVFTGCPSDLQFFDRDGNILSDTSVGETTPAETDNIGDQNYTRNAAVIKSYLVDEGTRRLRVEYSEGTLTREYFDTDGRLLSRNVLPVELPVFGGFMEGSDGYYLLFGQENTEQDNSKEVIRAVRYSKDWKRIGATSIYGENTAVPFDFGSASMTESGGMLYIRTCHKKYDGHQANLTAVIRESDMTLTWIKSSEGNVDTGYVSHSFNQIIKADGNDIIAIDHGDTFPRGVILFRYAGKAGQETLGAPKYVNVLSFAGAGNYTGASIGALEVSSTHYLVAGNSVAQDSSSSSVRNIFVTATSKNDFTKDGTSFRWVTSYSGSEVISTPLMTALPDGRFLLMWTVDGVLNYCFLSEDGEVDGTIYSGEGSLSDCRPYVKDNAVWWYVTSSTAPIYYYISLDDPSEAHMENAGHRVTLDPMGGTLSDSLEMDVLSGGTYGELPVPTREAGYRFLGWFTRPKYGTQITSTSTVRVRGDETLYAHWQHNWRFSEDTGKLELLHYFFDMNEWTSIRPQVETIVIGEEVTSLYYSQFYKCYYAKTVVIPNSVTEIKMNAFFGVPVETVYFLGTEEEWDAISIDIGNTRLTDANIIFVTDRTSLSYALIEGYDDMDFTGSAIEPEVVVTQLGDVLTQNSDYTVSYSDNTNAGTATISVTGCGKYHGSVSSTFTIKPASISSATVEGLVANMYTGSAITPSPVVSINGNELTEGTDYTLTYLNNTKIGTATITITGCGNYTGTKSTTFEITKVPISTASITGLADKTYTGAEQTQTPEVKLGGKTLTAGVDYTVSYSDNINAGTATVTVTGCGNYTGTVAQSFKILPIDITGAMVAVEDQPYTGRPIEPGPSVTMSGVTLNSDTDFKVVYSDNVEVGEVTMTITGQNNCTGTVTATFKIIKAAQALQVTSGATSVVAGTEITINVSGNKGTVHYRTSDASVATVNENGVVTTLKAGKAVITVNAAATESFDEASTDIEVTVLPAVTDTIPTADKPLKVLGSNTPKPSSRPAKEVSPENPVAAKSVQKTITAAKSDADPAGSSYSLLQAKGTAKSTTSIKVSWKKVKGAGKYIVYGNKCGKKNKYKKIKTVTGTSFTQKKLKKGTYYKYIVVAVKDDQALATSKTIHVATKGGKYGNSTKVTFNKKKVTIGKNKTAKVKALVKKGKQKAARHRAVKYESGDIRIATVNSTGRIKGISKGTCYIYAYAQNGVSAKIKVVVK